ncbi:MAG: hypothetical protein JST26_01210 [Bacteroidetes bacterium]|nr:hypothetical protein [Bacteroidota bacterium]
MKKTIILAVAVSALGFAACKKDRTCTCTNSNSLTSATTQDVYTITKSSKAVAKANCASTKETTNGVTSTRDCKLN